MCLISTTISVLRRSVEGLALGVVLAAAPALAEPPLTVDPQIRWLARGLFCPPDETGRREAPDTMAGWIHVPEGPIEMVAESAVAPAALGLGFGVWFRLRGLVPSELRFEVHHPPMGAQGVTMQSWTNLSNPMAGDAVLFQFDLPEELVTGPWEFRAFEGATELFRAGFTVVPPGEAPDLVALCRPGAMLS